ncbi:MAG: hypothetical protein J6C40_11640 [Lentisphaeria bacterium]|nr:hypothetical protein [Lentisphaeria bacterium]
MIKMKRKKFVLKKTGLLLGFFFGLSCFLCGAEPTVFEHSYFKHFPIDKKKLSNLEQIELQKAKKVVRAFFQHRKKYFGTEAPLLRDVWDTYVVERDKYVPECDKIIESCSPVTLWAFYEVTLETQNNGLPIRTLAAYFRGRYFRNPIVNEFVVYMMLAPEIKYRIRLGLYARYKIRDIQKLPLDIQFRIAEEVLNDETPDELYGRHEHTKQFGYDNAVMQYGGKYGLPETLSVPPGVVQYRFSMGRGKDGKPNGRFTVTEHDMKNPTFVSPGRGERLAARKHLLEVIAKYKKSVAEYDLFLYAEKRQMIDLPTIQKKFYEYQNLADITIESAKKNEEKIMKWKAPQTSFMQFYFEVYYHTAGYDDVVSVWLCNKSAEVLCEYVKLYSIEKPVLPFPATKEKAKANLISFIALISRQKTFQLMGDVSEKNAYMRLTNDVLSK